MHLLPKIQRTTQPAGQAAAADLFKHYARNASRRGLTFTLAFEQFRSACASACAYCGVEPSRVHRPLRRNGGFAYNGLDRVENNRGYEPDNVVPCCTRCNTAKSDLSRDEFLGWVARVYARAVASTETM